MSRARPAARKRSIAASWKPRLLDWLLMPAVVNSGLYLMQEFQLWTPFRQPWVLAFGHTGNGALLGNPNDVGVYLARSFDYVIDVLRRADRSEPCALDPSGDAPLRRAKQVRRETLRRAGPDALREQADLHFRLPVSTLAFAPRLAEPLYVPKRVASN